MNKGPKEAEGENQALTQNPKSTNASSVDARSLEATLPKSRENSRLVRELRRKLAKQARDSGSKLKELKDGDGLRLEGSHGKALNSAAFGRVHSAQEIAPNPRVT